MATENSVSNNFRTTFVDSIDVFDCRLPGVKMRAGKVLELSLR